MKSFSPIRQVVATVALAALSFGAQSALVYSLANNGNSLIRFDSSAPGAVTTVGSISGATGRLSGLDFRPADGLLYGFQQSTSNIYRVNPSSGATTFVSSSFFSLTGLQSGIDFNPTVDRLRVVNVTENNLRINVDTGARITDSALAYAGADVNANANPNIVDAAYTFSDRNPATGTTLYYIDSVLSTLVTTSDPNGGVLNTVGSGFGFNVNTNFVGFDIFTDLIGTNTAFASLQVGATTSLYTVNLTTGAATSIGTINASQLFGLAVQPTAVPEPGTLALFGAAVLAFGMTRRRVAGGLVKTLATRA